MSQSEQVWGAFSGSRLANSPLSYHDLMDTVPLVIRDDCGPEHTAGESLCRATDDMIRYPVASGQTLGFALGFPSCSLPPVMSSGPTFGHKGRRRFSDPPRRSTTIRFRVS